MSQNPHNQVITLVADEAQAVEIPKYYERIILSNATTDPIFVRTDGNTVTTAEGQFAAGIMPSAWRNVGNDQPKEPLVTQEFGSTTQDTENALPSGYPTYVSIIGAASGTVIVEFG